MEINKVIQFGREVLLNNGIDPREARLLLAYVLNIKIEELLAYKEVPENKLEEYVKIIEERKNGEPFAYIVGNKEFMGLNFKVNKNVLIPREDTEVLVEEVLKIATKNDILSKIKILDMCTGSGCIAISLAKYLQNAEVTAVDISIDALEVAKYNAKKNNVEITFINSNLFEKVSEKFDIIVSNPPYIKTLVIDELQKEVKKEPILALDGGELGLDFYEEITRKAKFFLNENGILAYEIGFDQGDEVVCIMKKNGYKDVQVRKDIAGNNRVVIGKLI